MVHQDMASIFPSIHDVFADAEIRSLSDGVEHINVSCVDRSGKITKTKAIDSVSNDGQARSRQTLDEIGDPCGDQKSVWWHTHAATLSSMSTEDRITAGVLKVASSDDVMCAVGIEGFSCHDLYYSPPSIVTKRWDKSFFDKLKVSKIALKSMDSDDKWVMQETKESTVDHLLCSTMNNKGVVGCVGVDWKTGINHFPIGAYNQVIYSGNVDISPAENGFNVLASPVDNKFECLSLNIANTKKILYCR